MGAEKSSEPTLNTKDKSSRKHVHSESLEPPMCPEINEDFQDVVAEAP